MLTEWPGLSFSGLRLAAIAPLGASYDAHYLVLAEELRCELWTVDRRFYLATRLQYPAVHCLGEPA